MLQLKDCTWPMIEAYLNKNTTIIVPVGSTEQHGPTGLLGTDFMTAESIAFEVSKRTGVLVAPSINFGMAMHHMAFPGTISLTPATFMKVIIDVIKSLRAHGFKNILFINGHGGNIAPLTTAFCQIKSKLNEDTGLYCENWWRNEAVRAYEEEHFGKENGTHATCGEVSVTMADYPEAFSKIESIQFELDSHRAPYSPLSAVEFKKHYPDGRMNSNPGLSSREHGAKLKQIAANEIYQKYLGSLFNDAINQ